MVEGCQPTRIDHAHAPSLLGCKLARLLKLGLQKNKTNQRFFGLTPGCMRMRLRSLAAKPVEYSNLACTNKTKQKNKRAA